MENNFMKKYHKYTIKKQIIMEKLMHNIYLIECSIFLAIGLYDNFIGSTLAVFWFALAFLMAVFHLDSQINRNK
jgi:hypothetical protein